MSGYTREAKVAITAEDKFSGTFATFTQQVDRAAKSTTALERQTNNLGVSAKQTAAAMRTVPAQLTDALTQLQGGQSPFTVLLQQGGQLKDSFGGIVPAAKGLASTIGGLINPFTLAAGAAAAMAVAYKQGADESDAFAKALILTGNASGTTVGQLNQTAKALAGVVGTQGQAAEALTALAAVGVQGGESMGKFAEAAVRLSRETGKPIEETVKQFAELGKAPAEASAKLNDSLHYLTLTTYEQIKALEDSGRTADAAKLAQTSYADAMIGRSKQLEDRLGYLQSAWRSVSDGAKKAWDAMLNVGRESTLDDKLADLQKKLADRLAYGPLSGTTTASHNKGNAALQIEIQQLTNAKKIADDYEASIAKYQQQQNAGIAAEQALAKIREGSASKAEKLNKELAEYRKNLDAIRAVNPNSQALDPKRIAQDEANIRGKYKESAPRVAKDRQSEAERYLENLQKQVEQTRDLTAYEQALADIQGKRISGITPAIEKQILANAQLIDQERAKAAERKENEKGLDDLVAKIESDSARVRSLVSQTYDGRLKQAVKDVELLRAAMNDPEFQSPAMQKALVDAARKLNEDMKKMAETPVQVGDKFDDLQKTIESTMLKSADAIADFAVSGQGSISDIGKAFAKDVLRMIIVSPVQDAARTAAKALTDAFKNISLQSSLSGGGFDFGGFVLGLFGLGAGSSSGGGSGVVSGGSGIKAGKQTASGIADGMVGSKSKAAGASAGHTFIDNSVINVNGDVSPKTVQMIEAAQARTKSQILRSMRTGGAFANG